MKKYVKIATAGVLSLSVFLSWGCSSQPGPSTRQETTTQIESSQEQWYEDILEDDAVKTDYPYHRLLDINQDGTEELFLSSTEESFIGDEDKAEILSCQDGEAVTLLEVGGGGGDILYYDEPEQELYHYSRLSGEEHIVIYKLDKSTLVEVQTSDYYAPYHGQNETDADVYYVDGKETPQENAAPIWDKLENGLLEISYGA